MARIRTIKPQFFKNEDMAELPMVSRMLFIGLWCLADVEGRLEDRPKRIKAELFPYDSVEVDSLLSRLQSAGFITRYEFGELKVIQIINFKKHQRITGTEASTASEYPEPEKETKRKHFGSTLDDWKGREGKGEGKEEIGSGSPPPLDPKPPSDFVKSPFSEKFFQEWGRWKKFKKDQFKFSFKSQDSEQSALTELFNHSGGSEEVAAKIINYSIANAYKGLFPLKNEQGGKQSTVTKKNSGAIDLLEDIRTDYLSNQRRE